MPGPLPYLIRDAILLYGVVGAVVAVAFVVLALDRLDPAAAGAYAFRPLLLPGLVLLWPVVALRWLRLERRRR